MPLFYSPRRDQFGKSKTFLPKPKQCDPLLSFSMALLLDCQKLYVVTMFFSLMEEVSSIRTFFLLYEEQKSFIERKVNLSFSCFLFGRPAAILFVDRVACYNAKK